MPDRAHLIAGLLAPLCIATFFLSTIITELFGSHSAVAQLKSLIVTTGLWIMVPLMAVAGGSGIFIAVRAKADWSTPRRSACRSSPATGCWCWCRAR
jgi:hypothetical protein